MGDNKTKLLQALTIDRTPADAPHAALWPKLVAGAVMLVALGAVALTMSHFATGTAERGAADAPSATASGGPSAAPEPVRSGLAVEGVSDPIDCLCHFSG